MVNKELEMAKEVARIYPQKKDYKEAYNQVLEQHKKAQSPATTQGKEQYKNNVMDILTDKVDLDNYGVYNKDGQILMGVDEI